MQKLDDRFRKFLAFFISQTNKKSILIPSGLKYPASRKQLDRHVRFTELLTEPEWKLEKRKRKNRIRKGLSNYPRANLSFRFEKVKPPPLFGVKGNYDDYLSENLGDLQQLESLFLHRLNSGKNVAAYQLELRLSDLFFFGFEDQKEQIFKLVVQSWGEAMEEMRIAIATDKGTKGQKLTETVPSVVNVFINEKMIGVPEKTTKPGKKADDKIQERKQIVKDHIKQKRDFYDPQKFAALLEALDKANIPHPEYRGKKTFDHPWQEVRGKFDLEDQIIVLLDRDRFKK